MDIFSGDTDDESDNRCCGCGSVFTCPVLARRPDFVNSSSLCYGGETDRWIQCPSVREGLPREVVNACCACVDEVGICCMCGNGALLTEDHCTQCYGWLQDFFEKKYKRAVVARQRLVDAAVSISDHRLETVLQYDDDDDCNSFEYQRCHKEYQRQVCLTKLDDAMYRAVKDEAFVVPSWWGYLDSYARRVCGRCWAPYEEVKVVDGNDLCPHCHLEMLVEASLGFVA